MKDRKYKFKLDFYYTSLIIYLFFLIGYAIIRGTFTDGSFYVVLNDPIIFIVLVFIALFFILLISNYVRSRELIFQDDKFIVRNRFGERSILYSDILQVKFSREKRRYSEEKSPHRIVKLKLKSRKRWLRMRLADYSNNKELVNEFKNIQKNISQQSA
ncbi:MAG TPA: hypothetical protein VHP32_11185 [Ignavibacteria bacterium]|nr:hypothetical protein [Ignavibacteria bacterium]